LFAERETHIADQRQALAHLQAIAGQAQDFSAISQPDAGVQATGSTR
jgi:hypothetical protein